VGRREQGGIEKKNKRRGKQREKIHSPIEEIHKGHGKGREEKAAGTGEKRDDYC